MPESSSSAMKSTGVTFRTSAAALQRLFDAAEQAITTHIVEFAPGLRILVEGGGYYNAWIETQPMGGEMYAKRDLALARNNQEVFLRTQRADGRLPGVVMSTVTARKSGHDLAPPEGMVWHAGPQLLASYVMLQGYCFPDPAWKVYFWTGRDRDYLQRLYTALEAHDAYLWRTRDSDGDGLLETWCIWDTGEDASSRFVTRGAPTRWPFEYPPLPANLPDATDPEKFLFYWRTHHEENLPPPRRDEVMVPFASMDVMAYSYDGRATLAKIARELGNGREAFWRAQAEDVRQRVIRGLWDPVRHACFDHDRTGRRLEELTHNNLRAMYYGLFTQAMADAFIREHLLNPEEFWTPVPLVSIAIHEPLFQNVPGNNWGGQPQGLTYQRAIRALENYGHYAEVTLVGRKFLALLIANGCSFFSQFDAHTGKPSGIKADGYGPSILAALEYTTRLHGIHLDVEHGEVWWSALADGGAEYTYTQRWGDESWTLEVAEGKAIAKCGERIVFTCSVGVRVITDMVGRLSVIVGIDDQTHAITIQTEGLPHALTVAPNQVYLRKEIAWMLAQAAPFHASQL